MENTKNIDLVRPELHDYIKLEDINNNMEKIDNAVGEINTEIDELQQEMESCFQSVSSGKTQVANAITDKGINTNPTDTFATMANNINSITTLSQGTNDANATAGTILTGNSAYVKGQKINGTMANNGTMVFSGNNGADANAWNEDMATGSAHNQYVGGLDLKVRQGYCSGGTVRLHIPNLTPENIKKGVKVGWNGGYIQGTHEGGISSSVNGIIRSYRVAKGDSISIGEFVQWCSEIDIDSNGNVVKRGTNSTTNGVAKLAGTYKNTVEAVELDNNLVLLSFYGVVNNKWGFTLSLVKIENDVVTMLDGRNMYDFSGSSYDWSKGSTICRIDGNHVLYLEQSFSNSYLIYAYIVTISNDKISVSNATQVNCQGYRKYIECIQATSTRFHVFTGELSRINTCTLEINVSAGTIGVVTSIGNIGFYSTDYENYTETERLVVHPISATKACIFCINNGILRMGILNYESNYMKLYKTITLTDGINTINAISVNPLDSHRYAVVFYASCEVYCQYVTFNSDYTDASYTTPTLVKTSLGTTIQSRIYSVALASNRIAISWMDNPNLYYYINTTIVETSLTNDNFNVLTTETMYYAYYEQSKYHVGMILKNNWAFTITSDTTGSGSGNLLFMAHRCGTFVECCRGLTSQNKYHTDATTCWDTPIRGIAMTEGNSGQYVNVMCPNV